MGCSGVVGAGTSQVIMDVLRVRHLGTAVAPTGGPAVADQLAAAYADELKATATSS